MHTSKSHKQKFQDNKEVKEILEFKTENVQDYIEKPTFVELKEEDISKWELNNPPAVQIKTEIPNLHSCSICNQGFPRKTLLKNHNASVHEGKLLFHCEICNKEFPDKSSLIRHTINVHTEKFQDNKKEKDTPEIKKEHIQDTLGIKTEYVQDFVEKSTFVELKQENVTNTESDNPPALQNKTEILNLENESAQNDGLILGV